MTSTIRTTNVGPAAGGTTTNLLSGLAKAYVSYDATTDSVDDTFNRSSTTDNGAGDATHAWTNAAAAATYPFSFTGTTDDSGNTGYGYVFVSSGTATRGYRTTGSHRIATGYGGSASLADFDIYAYLFWGDLA
jgi:hypothetical protein